MMPETVVQGFLDVAWNGRDLDAFPRFVSRDVAFHPPRGRSRAYDEYFSMARDFQASFPDLRFETTRVIAHGELVAMHLTITGTNTGPFRGKAATGRAVRVEGRPWARVAEGKIVEFWQMFDELGMLQQLGHVDAGLLGHARE